MIKSLFKISLVAVILGLFTFQASALTSSQTVFVGSMTNALVLVNGSATISQIIVTATTATNVSVNIVDTPTNVLTYVVPAYTNSIQYATNYITSWTNFYGVAQSDTNIALITTNVAVASVTNNYPVRLSIAALASTSSTFSGVNYYFNNGVWLTNTGSGTAAVTITYRQ